MKGVFRFTPEQSQMLSEAAYDRLINNLMKYGNKPGDKQKVALRKLIETLTAMAGGEISGRIAFPLQTGVGKTLSIVAFAATLVDHSHDEVGIVICASKVEALCDIKRALMREGVPEERIGLIHSYRYDPKKADQYINEHRELPQGYASLPRTNDNQSRQILLTTHQRIRGGTEVEGVRLFNDNPRQLVVWDESLIVSDSFSVSHWKLAQGINYLDTPEVRKTPDQEDALAYLKNCKEIVTAEIERQKEDSSAEPRRLNFPYLHRTKIELYKSVIGEGDVVEPLKTLLDISQNPVRILVEVEQGEGVITYDIVIPEELDNVVILDASHLIRQLARMDSSIRIADIPPDMISYQNVTLHQLPFPSGRHSMQREFEKRKGRRLVSQEIIDVVKDIPRDEGIIIFTFRKRSRLDFTHTLKSDFMDAGIDIDEEIEIAENQYQNGGEPTRETVKKPRFIFLHWGQETSLSEYSYCSNVVLAGVLHRSHIDIASAISGQKDDLCVPLKNSHIREVMLSENAHCVYQAINRGSSRVIDGEVTRPMKVWLIHKGDLNSLIEQVMPGILWEKWRPKYLPVSEHKIERLRDDIKAFLSSVSTEVLKLSIHKLKKLLNVSNIPASSFTLALQKAISGTPDWLIQERSIVRASSLFLVKSEN